jgi:calcineurin-like phosphoesterase family protein
LHVHVLVWKSSCMSYCSTYEKNVCRLKLNCENFSLCAFLVRERERESEREDDANNNVGCCLLLLLLHTHTHTQLACENFEIQFSRF